MKKFIASTLIAIALISPSVAEAADVQSIGYTNIRSGDNTNSPIIGHMNANQTLPYIGGNPWWTAVMFNGRMAYVSASSKYTRIVGDSTAPAPSPAPNPVPAPAPAPAPVGDTIQRMIDLGNQFKGRPYAFSNTKTSGSTFIQGDCSGFTRFVFAQLGIKLSGSSRTQATNGSYVAKSDLRAGDLVFSDTNRDGVINHVSIYLGNDQLLHTYKVGVGVTFSKFSGSTWDKTYVTARRVL